MAWRLFELQLYLNQTGSNSSCRPNVLPLSWRPMLANSVLGGEQPPSGGSAANSQNGCGAAVATTND